MRQRWLARGVVGAGVACVLGIAGALAFGPLVRERVERAAATRGLSVSVRRVEPQWGGVRLSDVVVRPLGVEAVSLRLEEVEAEVGTNLDVRSVRATGGQLIVTGEPEVVRADLESWWDARRSPEGRASAGALGPGMELRDIGVSWESAGRRLDARRVRVVRQGSGSVRVEVGSIQVSGEEVGLSGERIEVEFEGAGASRRVVKLEAQGLEVDLRLDDAKEIRDPGGASANANGKSAGVVASGVGGGARQATGVPPSTSLMATGVPSSSSLTGHAGPILPSLGGRVREGLRRAAQVAERHLGEAARFQVGGLRLRVRRGGQVLNLGPSSLEVTRNDGAVRVRLVPQSTVTGAEALALEAEVPFAVGPFVLKVDGGPVALAALGVQEGDFGLRGVDETRIEARGKISLAREEDAAEISAGGRLENLSVYDPALSTDVVAGVDFGWDLAARVASGGRRVEVSNLTLRLGDVTASLTGSVVRDAGGSVLTGKGELPLSACSSLLEAVPAGLAPFAASMKMRGTFALRGQVEFDSRTPLGARIGLSMENGCKIEQFGEEIAPARFLEPFRRIVKNYGGLETEVLSGPGTPGWVPYTMISANLVTAVLVCEDGHFFSHDGFDVRAMEKSIRENLSQGRFVRGASTISMQLAKNLYLTREKTLARKLKEALLTQLLEQELSKHELIELYLNVIEYAPGVYGAAAAAQHYFGTTPDALSLGQAFYIASVLPNPKRQYFVRDGQVSRRWTEYLRSLMHVARRIGRITDAELQRGLAERVQYQVSRSTYDFDPVDGEQGEGDAAAGELLEGGLEGGVDRDSLSDGLGVVEPTRGLRRSADSRAVTNAMAERAPSGRSGAADALEPRGSADGRERRGSADGRERADVADGQGRAGVTAERVKPQPPTAPGPPVRGRRARLPSEPAKAR